MKLLDLPAELLAAILGRLPVAELVRARQVCRQFRGVVAMLEEEDRRHYFECGVLDLTSIPQLPHTVPFHEAADGAHGVPCTCGAIHLSSAMTKKDAARRHRQRLQRR